MSEKETFRPVKPDFRSFVCVDGPRFQGNAMISRVIKLSFNGACVVQEHYKDHI